VNLVNKQFRTYLLVLLAWTLLPLCGEACDCPYAGAPCKAFANTPTVFTGRVTKISTINRQAPSGDDFKDRLVLFEVERSYRGWEAKTAEVVTGWGGGDCGYDFREGVRYLVYAYPHRETGKLYTGICQRTRRLSEAADDLEYLSKKDDPSHGGGIEGTIEELDSKNRIEVFGFLQGIPVLISGPSGRQTVVSQKDGRFQLWGLSPGSYRVTPVFPKSFLPDEQTVKLGRNSCAELRFLATPPPRRSTYPRGENRWHQVFQGRLARVEVERTLYERRKEEDCFIAVRVTNLTNRPIGVDLRNFWDVIYPNSWGFSKTPAPEAIEEERIIRQSISANDQKRMMLDYSESRLAPIIPNRSITYFRGFTFGRNIRKEIDSAGKQYLIVGLDGALRMTDGQTTEEMIFPANDEAAGSARWVAIQLPVTWRTVSRNSLVVEERR
jgi:hypothetical protein